ICPNGGATLLCKPTDILIIIAYEYRDRSEVMNQGHQAKVLVADEHNRCAEFIEQGLVDRGAGLEFQASSYSTNNN
ncbi:aspartate 1-decarboxylase, partial [Pleurocapsales cyanobacterium LEGE 10410]|nr:aspartate 1-decarboxylase [Pleurocapsales cyanobacterium LEGE 10410]